MNHHIHTSRARMLAHPHEQHKNSWGKGYLHVHFWHMLSRAPLQGGINLHAHQQRAGFPWEAGPLILISQRGNQDSDSNPGLWDSRTQAVYEPLREQETKQRGTQSRRGKRLADGQMSDQVLLRQRFSWSHILTLWPLKKLHVKMLNRQIVFTTMGVSWAHELEKLGWWLNLTHSPQFLLSFFTFFLNCSIIFIRR